MNLALLNVIYLQKVLFGLVFILMSVDNDNDYYTCQKYETHKEIYETKQNKNRANDNGPYIGQKYDKK